MTRRPFTKFILISRVSCSRFVIKPFCIWHWELLLHHVREKIIKRKKLVAVVFNVVGSFYYLFLTRVNIRTYIFLISEMCENNFIFLREYIMQNMHLFMRKKNVSFFSFRFSVLEIAEIIYYRIVLRTANKNNVLHKYPRSTYCVCVYNITNRKKKKYLRFFIVIINCRYGDKLEYLYTFNCSE